MRTESSATAISWHKPWLERGMFGQLCQEVPTPWYWGHKQRGGCCRLSTKNWLRRVGMYFLRLFLESIACWWFVISVLHKERDLLHCYFCNTAPLVQGYIKATNVFCRNSRKATTATDQHKIYGLVSDCISREVLLFLKVQIDRNTSKFTVKE